jgi:general secretion pathway protein M
MKFTLSPAMQRTVAISLALTVGLLLIWLIVAPLWSASSLHAEQVGMLKRQVRSMQSLVDAAPKYEALAKRLAADPQAQVLTFAAPQTTLAIAQLQGQISQIMTAAGATVMTSQSLPESAEGALVKVTVQTTLEAEVKSLLAAFHAIGAARPLLRVEKLTIRDPDGEWTNTPQENAPNKLQVDLTISAYMRRP